MLKAVVGFRIADLSHRELSERGLCCFPVAGKVVPCLERKTMSKLQAFWLSLAVAVFLLPAALPAQVKTDSSSAAHRRAATTGVVGGLLQAIAADTGQADPAAQPASTSSAELRGQTPKTPRRSERAKTRDDAIRPESNSPY